MKRWRWWLLGSILTAVVAMVGGLVWYHTPQSQTFYTDTVTIKQPADTARPRDILWQPPVKLSEIVNTTGEDYEPRLSWDGLTLYFVRGKAGDNADIYSSRRTPEGWTKPQPLDQVNSPYDDLGPEPSLDGQSLYLYTDRPGGSGGYDLWVSRRTDQGWQPAVNMGPAVNSEYNDYGPAITPDGGTLYFASNRPQPLDTRQPHPDAWPATVREDLFYRTYDLYSAPLTERGDGQAQPLSALNTGYNEGSPAVSTGGDFLYFSSDRPGGEGGYDLYRARCIHDTQRPARNLGPPVNSPANELDPGLTTLGYGLYFSSDRPLERVTPEEANDYNLYYSSSREVFLDVERSSRPPIDWAALWRTILPNLLWALLALLLLLVLLALLGDVRRRKLSLLARCLLASLMAHLLLMMLLNVWGVTASVVNVLGGRGEIRVALSPPAPGDALAAQVRGDLTDVAPPKAAEYSITHQDMQWNAEPANAQMMLAIAREPLPLNEEVEITPVANDARQPAITEPLATPVLASLDSACDLEMALPVETRRLDTREQSLQLQSIAMSPQRPAPAAATPADASTPRLVTLLPEDARRDSATEHVRSIAGTQVPRDAVAAVPDAVAKPDERRAPVPPLELAVATPAEATPLAEAPREIGPQAMAVASELPRRDTNDIPPHAADYHALHDILPVSAPFRGDDAALAAAAQIRFPDAKPQLPQFHKSRNPERATFATPAMSLTDLALPHEQLGSNGTTAERSPQIPAAGVAAARPALHSPLVLPPRAVRVELQPQPTPSNTADKTALVLKALAPRQAQPLPLIGEPHANAVMTSQPEALHLQLGLPVEVQPLTDAYAQRVPARRSEVLERAGGSEETERAVRLALQWLADHQSPDGHWDGQDFDEGCGECGGQTDYNVDVALTGLSLLCFLGAGHTHLTLGPYQDNATRGLAWLTGQQESDGDLRGGESMYSHGIAAIALAEAQAMTNDPRLTDPVARAVDFIVQARNEELGGWRYKPGQQGDTSVLGWQVMALKSARTAGVDVPVEAFEEAHRWLALVESQERCGLYAYRPGQKVTPAMTAEGIFVQQLLGLPRDDPRMQTAMQYISQRPPDWERRLNTYNWYYTTLALFHYQGEPWSRWNEALTEQLLAHQRKDGGAAGSWDPDGEWAAVGGRIYQTAICTLMLEVYYRYLPMYSLDQTEETIARVPDAVGTIHGQVADALTGAPIAGAQVRLDLPNAAPLVSITDADGRYELSVPRMPKFFALSAAHTGYVPSTANVPAARLRDSELTQDFQLQPVSEAVVAVEGSPEVHHLGNDRWEGRINSQFQKTAEGRSFTATFDLHAGQLPPNYTRAAVWLLAKGVQCPHEIRVNGHVLDTPMESSPGDGSFGEFAAWFDPRLLVEGENTVEIRTSRCRGDLDDFEFVNLQIHLSS